MVLVTRSKKKTHIRNRRTTQQSANREFNGIAKSASVMTTHTEEDERGHHLVEDDSNVSRGVFEAKKEQRA
jgi:hypothetical protein